MTDSSDDPLEHIDWSMLRERNGSERSRIYNLEQVQHFSRLINQYKGEEIIDINNGKISIVEQLIQIGREQGYPIFHKETETTGVITNLPSKSDLENLPLEILYTITGFLSPRSKSKLAQTATSLSGISIFPDTPEYREIKQNIPNLTQVIHPVDESVDNNEYHMYGDLNQFNYMEKVLLSAAHLGYYRVVIDLSSKYDYIFRDYRMHDGQPYTMNDLICLSSVVGRSLGILMDMDLYLNTYDNPNFFNIILNEAFISDSRDIIAYLIWGRRNDVDSKLAVELIFKYDIDNLHFYLIPLNQGDEGDEDTETVYDALVDQIVKYDRIDLAEIYIIKKLFNYTYKPTNKYKVSKLHNIIMSGEASPDMEQYIKAIIEYLEQH